jgi:UDP-glucuronate decarboxylase
MRLPLQDLQQTTARISEGGGDALRGGTIMLTGGTGFIGRWLIETFRAFNAATNAGARMNVLSRNVARFRASAPHLSEDPSITMIEGDVREFAATPCDFVIHGATESSDALANGDPRLFVDTIDGTRNALDFAVHSGARRFLYLSSGAVYGRQPVDVSHIAEDFNCAPDVRDPQSGYGETKRAGELLCALYAKQFGLEVVIARGFAFIGPHLPLDRNFAAGNFLGNVVNGEHIEVRGDGTALRSYLYAADLAVWLWILLLRGAPGRAYNVGSESAVSIAELAAEAAKLTDPPLPVTIRGTPDPAKPPERYVPSTEAARKELGLTETVDWRTALRKTHDWYRGTV